MVKVESPTWYTAQEQGSARRYRRHISQLPRDFSRSGLEMTESMSDDERKEFIARMDRVVFPEAAPLPLKSTPAKEVAHRGGVDDGFYVPGTAVAGDMVLARDTPDSQLLWPQQVVSVGDGNLRVHYWATQQTTKAAVFRPALIITSGKNSGRVILGKPGHRDVCDKWMGSVPDDTDLVICKCKLTPAGAIPARVRRFMESHGFQHATM